MPINLLFHGIGPPQRDLEDGEERLWVSRARLHDILDVARDADASISVDDGNVSDVEVMLPALLDRGLSAQFFVLAGRLDKPGSLSRSAVRELHAAGMAIGTHGMHHRPWRGLSNHEQHLEFIVAREMIAETVGSNIGEAACPRGAYDRRSLADLRAHGYRRVHTSDGWPASHEAWLQPRYSISRDDDPDKIHRLLSGRPSRRQQLVHQAKALWKRSR